VDLQQQKIHCYCGGFYKKFKLPANSQKRKKITCCSAKASAAKLEGNFEKDQLACPLLMLFPQPTLNFS